MNIYFSEIGNHACLTVVGGVADRWPTVRLTFPAVTAVTVSSSLTACRPVARTINDDPEGAT